MRMELRYYTIPCLFFLTNLAYGQIDTTEYKPIAVFAVLSAPTSDFAEGYLTGFGLNLDFVFFPNQGISSMASVTYISNNVNYDKFRSTIRAISPGIPDPQIEVGPIKSLFFLFGFQSSILSSSNLSLSLSLQTGFLSATVPESKIIIGSTTTTSNSAMATTIALRIGAGFTLYKKYIVAFSYSTAKPQFDRSYVAEYGYGTKITGTSSDSGTLTSFNLMLGYAVF